MLFHVVPTDMYRDRAIYSRPCCYQRSPRYQQLQFGNMGFLHDILRPLMVMSHNNAESESCRGRRPCDTGKCQGVKRRGAQKGECTTQKREQDSTTACLDFRGFSADEINVKVTDNSIVVCGRHDDSINSFRVTRRLPLPPGVDKRGVICRYVDGKVILEIPVSAKDRVEGKPEGLEDEKKTVEKEKARCDPTKKSDTGDDEDDAHGIEIEKEVQAAFQEGMQHLFSTIFGVHIGEKMKKKDLPNESPENEEQPTEQTTTDRKDLFPGEDNKTVAGSIDKQMEVDEEKEQEEEDTCLMLKYDEKPSLRHDPSDIAYVEEQTAGDSPPPEQTAVRKLDEDEEVERLMSDGGRDLEKTQFRADENLPVSSKTQEELMSDGEEEEIHVKADTSSPQDFEIRFDLSNYKPEDIRVVVRDGDVIVEAERESKCEEYSETETLRRRICLPDTVDQSMLTSVLNAEGEMTIHAPFLSQAFGGKEYKTVPVVWE